MVQITSDNAEVSKILNEICEIIEGQGGSIHPDIIIKCHNNDVSVESSAYYGLDSPKDFAFKIPHELMVVYDDFVFEVDENQKIQIHSHVEQITPLQLRLTELMLGLYNATDKLRSHIKCCAWHIFKQNPEIIDLLINGRQGVDLNLISKFIKNEDQENLVLLTFFKTRLLGCSLYNKEDDPESVITPLVDAMNHHLKGGGYQNFYSPQGAFFAVPLVQPIEGNHECFVQYGVFDSLDTYIHYGFIPDNIPFLRSIPTIIDLEEWGSLEIKALNSYVDKADAPDGFKDLSFYMPIITASHDKNHVALSHTIIPGAAAPKSLRRIVSLAIKLLHPSMDNDAIHRLMLQAEATIWQNNAEYFQSMQKKSEELSVSNAKAQNLYDVSSRQMKILGAYKALFT